MLPGYISDVVLAVLCLIGECRVVISLKKVMVMVVKVFGRLGNIPYFMFAKYGLYGFSYRVEGGDI